MDFSIRPSRDQFYALGQAHFEFSDQIVRLYVTGPWNEEFVKQVHRSLREELKKRMKGAWALMAVITGSALCGPEALEAIRTAAASERAETGRMATAWVLRPGVEGRQMMSELLGRAYSGINPVRVYAREEDAAEWLHRELEGAAA